MKIYMAGFYSAHGAGTPNAMISGISDPKFVLESYHYMDKRKAEHIRKEKKDIFLDSGAFSMFTQGVEVNLAAYAKYIEENSDIIHVASNLDVIGRNNEEASYKNQKELEGYGAIICPVHHARDTDRWLQRYLDEGYDYIFLGGMVPEGTPYLLEWLDHVWGKYLTNPDGSPKIKVHGFGLTTLTLMLRYPWYSVDSTSWVMTSRYGSVYLDLPEANKRIKVDFSTQSTKQREVNSWHYKNLRPDERRVIELRLAELDKTRAKNQVVENLVQEATGFLQGYTPHALGEMYGWRDHMNIDFFNRLCCDEYTRFHQEQPKLFT